MRVAGNNYGARCTLSNTRAGEGYVNSSYHCPMNCFHSKGTVQFIDPEQCRSPKPGDSQNYRGAGGRTGAGHEEVVLKMTLEVSALAKREAGQAGLGSCVGNFPFKTSRTPTPFISMRIAPRLGAEGPKVFVFGSASSVLAQSHRFP